MRIENVTAKSTGRVSAIIAFPGAIIEGVVFEHCTFSGVKAEDLIKDASAPEQRNVTIEPMVKKK